jgi:hypothetical protein
MLAYILLALVVCLVTAGGAFLILRMKFYRDHAEAETARYDFMLMRALTAEGEKTKAETEYKFLQQTVVQMMQRPIAAVLQDEQVQQISQTMVSYCNAMMAKRSEVN